MQSNTLIFLVAAFVPVLLFPARAQDFQARQFDCEFLRQKVESALLLSDGSPVRGEYCPALDIRHKGRVGVCGRMAFAYYMSIVRKSDSCAPSGLVQAQLSDVTGERAFRFGDAYFFGDADSYALKRLGLLPVAPEDKTKTASLWYGNSESPDGQFALGFFLDRKKKFRSAMSRYKASIGGSELGNFAHFMIGRIFLKGGDGIEASEDDALQEFMAGGSKSKNCWSGYMHGAIVGKGTKGQAPDIDMAVQLMDWASRCSRDADLSLSEAVRTDMRRLLLVRKQGRNAEGFVPSCLRNEVRRLPDKKINVRCLPSR